MFGLLIVGVGQLVGIDGWRRGSECFEKLNYTKRRKKKISDTNKLVVRCTVLCVCTATKWNVSKFLWGYGARSRNYICSNKISLDSILLSARNGCFSFFKLFVLTIELEMYAMFAANAKLTTFLESNRLAWRDIISADIRFITIS